MVQIYFFLFLVIDFMCIGEICSSYWISLHILCNGHYHVQWQLHAICHRYHYDFTRFLSAWFQIVYKPFSMLYSFCSLKRLIYLGPNTFHLKPYKFKTVILYKLHFLLLIANKNIAISDLIRFSIKLYIILFHFKTFVMPNWEGIFLQSEHFRGGFQNPRKSL